MVFSSMTFLLFFLPFTLIGYYLLPRNVQNYWLLILSLLFYAWGAHKFAAVMVLSIAANYSFALLISSIPPSWKKRALCLSVIFNLSILFYNKYLNFTTMLLHQYVSSSVSITNIVLPIGISFFTFQAMSYVIDVYRGDAPVQKNPYYLGLYIAFFPQLIAGPIVRYTTVMEQIEGRTYSLDKFRQGMTRFMAGFSQKILLSNTFSVIADEAFRQSSTISTGFAWIGAVAYTLQIFFDFSGYSSMAIGLAKMFGFDFLENFNYPYIAKTVTDFWRRWHISLSQFFRDYVYFPLGGSRVDSTWKVFRNLFVVWLLTGIWHGANFTFLVWGLSYFVLLCFEKITGIARGTLRGGTAVGYRMITLVCIIGNWVLFRAESLTQAGSYLNAMVGLSGGALWDASALRYLNDYKIVFLLGLLFSTPLFPWLQEKAQQKYGVGNTVAFLYDFILIGCMILSISCLVMGTNNPFIYFNF